VIEFTYKLPVGDLQMFYQTFP